MQATTRTILHVDMDAFYASIEQRDNPALRGQPVVVGGNVRGVVAAASYEARAFGVRSAMPMREAERRCAQLVRIRPRMADYKAVSRQVFGIFREFTPLVEGLSLDEAFLDVTGSRGLHGDSIEIAGAIKQRIRDLTKLTASVGVATNKLVAKIASDLDKPDGLVVITPANCRAILDPLPAAVIPGIGRQTLARLRKVHVYTVKDLRTAPDRDLEPIFGRYTQRARDRAAGIDNRPVSAQLEEKSVSSEETYDNDLDNRSDMERELLRLAESTARRLRKSGLQAGTIHIKIRQSDFQTFTRQQSRLSPVNGTDQIFHVARELLATWLGNNPGARVRLLGVGGSNLSRADQPDLFADTGLATRKDADRAIDDIKDRFGNAAVGRARTLRRPE